ncbi:pilus assembly FimT family protein [Lyngbya confervoides]|uniref:Prepilin-type N-terminal cleavage/methylation domain-containing protein n=1 Tax=Lyngbya confervoides BDU141951 TaxID=1574623 RepID=A0ABD4T603_9CYAN|nr:prepilin-type N-terminal cleavage/methylation domain-containing protein [Lyngbya confervoides]MCM1984201.1 prepilin-type N-terminal cleavage/methylation domain-containing protein [Lyngbya confervoides BDU141951]
MRIFNAPRQTGFTVIEILITVVVLGVIASLSSVSLLSWYSNKKLEDSLLKVQVSLQEAQQSAASQGRTCELTLAATANPPTISASPSSCLMEGQIELTGINLRHSGGLNKLNFNYQGETGRFTPETLVLSSSDASKQYCLVIDGPLGLMRTGLYAENDPTGTTPSNCKTAP